MRLEFTPRALHQMVATFCRLAAAVTVGLMLAHGRRPAIGKPGFRSHGL